MKKILLGLGTIAMMGTPMVAVVACGNSKSSSNKDTQQDIDQVLQEFQNANLIVNPQNSVKAASGAFNAKILQDLGGYTGVYPGTPVPDGVTMTYKVNDIMAGKSDDLVVTIAKNGAQSKTFNILVDVTKVKLVDVNSEALAKANMTYDSGSKTLTIGDKVGEINYDISSIWDIEYINWGNNPQNILKIGNAAFMNSTLTTLNLSGLTNLSSIGASAFMNSTLTTLNLSGLTNLSSIANAAFMNSTLTTLNLSGLTNLTNIGDAAFNNSTLTILNLSGLTNLSSIGFAAFNNSALSTLNLSGLTSLSSIGAAAFAHSTLTSLNLSGLTSLNSIGFAAFMNSTLTTLNLSGLTNLNSIGENAFKSIQQNLQLRMEEAKYQELIYVDGGINNLNAIFGSNGNTVQRINP